MALINIWSVLLNEKQIIMDAAYKKYEGIWI